ncbi:MAG: glycosyltransferase, partial [Rickettsiales bacterium]|nr:glycosyltransferase [Rickettsiales bacterium]
MKLENSSTTNRRQKRRIIAIAAGGTGGHLFPALVVAKRMLEEGYKVIFFSDKRAMRFLK